MNESSDAAKERPPPCMQKYNIKTSRCSVASNRKQHSRLKIYAFWTLLFIVCLLAWANIILTVVVIKVLHLGKGMESLELLPEKGVIKLYGETYLGNLFKPDGKIKGFLNTAFEIKSDRGTVALEVEDNKGKLKNSLVIEQNGTHVRGIRDFIVGNSFSTEFPCYKLTKRSKKLEAAVIHTNHVTSDINQKLVLRSDLLTKLSGSEGTHIDGKEILWTADQEVLLKSINGSVILSAKDGINIKVQSIPVVRSPSMSTLSTQYKVCVCMPEGKLFRVPVPKDRSSHTACHGIDVSPTLNPCA